MHLNPGQIVVGRYEVIEQIGIGGMAIVYRARDRKLDRYVTLKVMREEFVEDEEFITRFSVEARAAASLNNQNIVSVFDVGQDGPVHFIVMEYIDGFTLKDLIKKRAPFENEQMLGVAIQIANAIDHAHSNQVIHRDIKPQNILVTSGGIVKVTDFGIARATGSKTMTAATNVMGSVHYFSPEQARGGFVDYKSDIYSLGIVMYEMATGRLPFDAEEAITVALMHLNDPLPDIRQFNPHISDSIIKIINKATDKVSTKRYQNASELCTDLKRALTDSTGGFVVEHELLEAHTKKISYDPKLADFRSKYSRDNTPTNTTVKANVPQRSYNQDKQNTPQRDYNPDRLSTPQRQGRNPFRQSEPLEDVSEKRMERKIITYAIITAVAIIILMSAIFFLGSNPGPKEPEEIKLPKLTGMKYTDAVKEAEKLGITLKVSQQEESDEYEEGYIIYYNEPDKVVEGDEISVVISVGGGTYTVPSVINKDYNEALAEFREGGYPIPEVEFVSSDNIAENVIMNQEPAANTKLSKKSSVKLTVSKGPENKTVKVPTVKNLTEADGIKLIQEVGLVVGREEGMSETVPKGVIIAQMPEPGVELNLNSTVTIIISSGPPATPSPSPTPSPKTVTKPLHVNLDSSVESETVHIKILEITGAGEKVILNQEIDRNSFPFDLPVTGTGRARYEFYFANPGGQDFLFAEQEVDFTGTANE